MKKKFFMRLFAYSNNITNAKEKVFIPLFLKIKKIIQLKEKSQNDDYFSVFYM